MNIKQTSRKNCDAFIPGSLHILVTNYILRNIFVTSLPKTTKNQVTKMGWKQHKIRNKFQTKKEETNPSAFFLKKPNRAEMTATVPIDPWIMYMKCMVRTKLYTKYYKQFGKGLRKVFFRQKYTPACTVTVV